MSTEIVFAVILAVVVVGVVGVVGWTLLARLTALGERLSADDRMEERVARQIAESKKETADTVQRFQESILQRLDTHAGRSDQRLELIRTTVDTKLHETLGKRLDSAYGQVSARLESLQKSLQEVHHLSVNVGDLKKVLTNVKSRGIWGEAQLARLLGDMLAPSQYEANAAVIDGSRERVEFAVKLPGVEEGRPVLLPIDAKFPMEDYRRLIDAREAGESDAVVAAVKGLERAIREQAKQIASKYIVPPATTDFAVMYLPAEGLYAEVLSIPGLFEQLQRDHRVTVAGPVTLSAFLSSLHLGFKTLAVQESAVDVLRLLGEVKNEMERYEAAIGDVKKKLNEGLNKVESVEQRARVMARKLRDVEKAPGEATDEVGAEPA